ncbi:hypothetical protein [Marinobacter zhejiangensis]|uniref:Uncharacterized protein n=1 Tax=Marinobacter zhejiangensis TaxID=488535 RepID=A0A1I4PAM3_9GAMM|nr:hypothetical protein [Marinobacter zhejiangensis]SFM24413.1 hypothetical protein SAMN04487963_1881 [Marinobacter zhejiangensis]
MPKPRLLIAAGVSLMLSHQVWAELPAGRQSFESCTLITSEYLTAIQLLGRGFTTDILLQTLPDLSPESAERVKALGELIERNGLEQTYAQINAEYVNCATSVYQEHGLPRQGSREAHFHFCAGENKVRFEILQAAILEAPQAEVRRQLAPLHQPVVETLYELKASEGITAVYDGLASELKRCVNGTF